MPRRPRAARTADLDRRLAPYRRRAAVLHGRDGAVVATLYVHTEVWWRQAGGHLWWRRFERPYELAECSVLLTRGGAWKERYANTDAEVDELLDEWSRGVFVMAGEPMRVSWLDDEESRVQRERLFGVGAREREDKT